MREERIPIPCNCAYRQGIFDDLESVWAKHAEKHGVHAAGFAYTMVQLATYIFKQKGASEDQIMAFFIEAIQSLQMNDDTE